MPEDSIRLLLEQRGIIGGRQPPIQLLLDLDMDSSAGLLPFAPVEHPPVPLERGQELFGHALDLFLSVLHVFPDFWIVEYIRIVAYLFAPVERFDEIQAALDGKILLPLLVDP